MHRRRLTWGLIAVLTALLAAGSDPHAAATARATSSGPRTASEHLDAILSVSSPPHYRRFGSPGMAEAAALAAATLEQAGFTVRRHDVADEVYEIDYRDTHAPRLERTSDGATFKAESAFNQDATTGPDGLSCTVRAMSDVTTGDCGFVPFALVSGRTSRATRRERSTRSSPQVASGQCCRATSPETRSSLEA